MTFAGCAGVVSTAAGIISSLRRSGLHIERIWGPCCERATPLTLLSPARCRSLVLLGHEHNGVPDEMVAIADECVEIPMIGRGASLNVAVAGSLVLYRLAGLA